MKSESEIRYRIDKLSSNICRFGTDSTNFRQTFDESVPIRQTFVESVPIGTEFRISLFIGMQDYSPVQLRQYVAQIGKRCKEERKQRRETEPNCSASGNAPKYSISRCSCSVDSLSTSCALGPLRLIGALRKSPAPAK